LHDAATLDECRAGAYGIVYKAQNRENGEFVALKRIRLDNEEEVQGKLRTPWPAGGRILTALARYLGLVSGRACRAQRSARFPCSRSCGTPT